MKIPSTRVCRTKSTRAVPMEASGRSSRGKYTLLMRFPLSTTERAAKLSELLNRFQARSPDSRYTGKFGVGLRRTTLNTSVNTARYRIGLSIDQAAPRTEDLYLIFTSLRIRLARISRARTSSRSRARGWSLGGSEVLRKTSVAAARIG